MPSIVRKLAASLLLMSTPAFGADVPPDRQLALLQQWWNGAFDNFRQIADQSGGTLSEPVYKPHARVHSVFQSVEAPAFGEHVMYLGEYRNGDIKNFATYLLVLTPAPDGVHVAYHTLKDKTRYVAEPKTLIPNLAAIKAARPSDAEPFRAVCNVVLKHDGDKFFGRSASKDCVFQNDSYFVYEVTVTPEYYGLRENARRLDSGAVSWESAPGSNFTDRAGQKAKPAQCRVKMNPGPMGNLKAPIDTTLVMHTEGSYAAMDFPGAPDLALMINTEPSAGYVLSLIDTATGLPMAATPGPGGAEPIKIEFGSMLNIACTVGL